jgi:uncharacterized protein (TIGR02145 family)
LCTFGYAQCGGASTVTFDGHTYDLVGIGTQCWFAENLRSDNYRNGDAIPGNLTDEQWIAASSGAQTVYGEGTSTVYGGSSDEVANLMTFGRLYNWYAVNDSRGLCPSGFHVPSDMELMTLEMALGMTPGDANSTGWRGTDQGAQLKTSSWGGTNSSGFSALPGGYRSNHDGLFINQISNGFWWSSSPNGSYAFYRDLYSGSSQVYRSGHSPWNGFSVRCIQDADLNSCLDPDNDGVCAENEISGCTDDNALNFNPEATEDDGSCTFGPAQCGGASTVTFDGHTYALVGIGSQCWFAENLRSDNYLNGDPIPGNLTDAHWMSTLSGAQSVFGEGTSAVFGGSSDEVANLATYGRLYNWYAVNDARSLCPSGFHVPSDEEWTLLENSLGELSNVGTVMKAPTPAWDGTNSSGFSALPGGSRSDFNGYFYYLGNNGYWWTSSSNGTNAMGRNLFTGNSSAYSFDDDAHGGFSVRCIQDADSNSCLDPDMDGVCAEDEISGCTDDNALNFNPAATEDDGSCTYGPAQCGGASSVTFDGHTYALVGIGTQCWFAENLRSDNYRNGDAIPGNLSNSQWTATSAGAQAVYNNSAGSLATYGRLYNWYAVNDSRGLCPSGFHVPSDGEWMTLEMALGMTSSQANSFGWRGTDQGVQLKATSWGGTNSSGFFALPGGYRSDANGNFGSQGSFGYWRTSTLGVSNGWVRYLGSANVDVYRDFGSPRDGFSVRCVKD